MSIPPGADRPGFARPLKRGGLDGKWQMVNGKVPQREMAAYLIFNGNRAEAC
jgi:hypothetical protein